MKINVNVTVDLTPQQVRDLKRIAESCGHGHGDTKAPGRLIRRYLTGLVLDAVAYSHEKISHDYDDV